LKVNAEFFGFPEKGAGQKPAKGTAKNRKSEEGSRAEKTEKTDHFTADNA